MNDTSQEHIAVAVRVRPINAREVINQGDRSCWKCNPNFKCLHQVDEKGSLIPNSVYTYDCVFGPEDTTERVYSGVGKHIVDSFMQGINGTIFAYGQTSSGKTYTMHGDETSPGLLYLASKDIFDYVDHTPSREFILRASYVEIYKEEVKDLLDPLTPTLRIRESYERGVYVESKEEVIHNYQEILNAIHLLSIGEKNRHVGVTNMNQQSSRSHTIFKIVCESRLRDEAISEGADPGGVLVGQLSLVDLAGSESVRFTGATGETLDEARKINLSLSVLSRVISSLATKTENSHVSYRDSKLTRILQSSLDGNARTAIIACVTPSSSFCYETISTLKFAQRAKSIHTSAKVNEMLDDKGVIRKLKKEIEELRKQLKEGGSGSSSVPPGSSTGAANMVIAVKEEEKKQLEGEKKQLEGEKRQLEGEKKQLEEEKKQLEEEKNQLEEEKKQLEGEKRQLMEEVQRRDALAEEDKAEREKTQQEAADLQRQLAEALQRIEEAHTEREAVKGEYAMKRSEAEELKTMLGSLQCVAAGRVKPRQKLEEARVEEEALQQARREIAQLRTDREGLEQRLAAAESAQGTLKRVEEEWAGLMAEKKSAEAERDELSRKVAEMRDTMEGVLKSVESLYSTEREERQRAAALEEAVTTVTEERDALQASVNSQASINKALQAQSALLEQKQRSLKHQWTSEAGQLRKAKEELSKRLGSAVAEEKRLRAVLAEKEASLQSASQCIQQMTLELHTLQTVIASNDDAIDELEACEVVSNDDLGMLKELFLRQKQELLKSEKEVKEARVLNEELMRSLEGKEGELNQMECELNEAREVKERLGEEVKRRSAASEELRGEVRELKGKLEEKERKLKEEMKKKEVMSAQLREREIQFKEKEEKLMTELKEKEEKLEMELKEKEKLMMELKEKEEKEKEAKLEKEAPPDYAFPSTVENDSPSTMSESVLHDDRPTVEALQEEKTRLQTELAESQDRVARLQQTIRSKYAEYKQMKDSVAEAREAATRLGADFDKLRKKYTAAKTRIAHLEKSKLSTSEMEKIKQLLKTKEAMREECQGLRAESKQLHEQISSMKEEMTQLKSELSDSTRVLREKDLKIDELESDLKEAQNSTTSVYGNQFLENENLMLSVKVNELQQQLTEANNKLKRASETPHKKRRREEPARQVQSPEKRNKVSEFDIDDPSKCNTQ